MKVIRNINNNVAVCVDDNNHEVIAFGKGIGFKKAPYEIELSQIDRTYYNLDPHYISLLNELPEDVLEVSYEIVKKGSAYLNVELNRTFWFSLCDHINFAIENYKKGLILSNPMTNEIRHLYEKEMLLGKWAVKHIDRRLHIRLPQSEEGNIAMHFINAKQQVKKTNEKDDFEHFVEDITDIVESEMNIIIDRSSFSYSRFVTHLKYLLKRTNQMAQPLSDNIKMYEDVYRKYPELRKVIETIKCYIYSELNIEPSKEELLYLMIHINRLCAKDGL
ncbi:PRD domain-containing protein [Floccifex sp.]|uniref:PRD domain-containing protein n=1 Tax=Floccifex sp. TaxID=2815810 RepID=UPI003F0B01B5